MTRKTPAKFTNKLSKIIDKLYEKGPQQLYNFDRRDIEDLLSMRDTIFVYDTFVDLTPGAIRAMDNRVKNLHLNLQKFQVESANRLADDQLHHAIIDALNALKVARTWEDNGAGEAKYLDQLSVMRREQKSRESDEGTPRQNPKGITRRLPDIGRLTITPDPEGAGKPAKNTAVIYMYRDASNYKSHHRRVVLQGLLKGDLKTKIMSLSGDGFIASQVGFKELAPELWEGKGPSEDDHVFSELVSVEDTPDAPTIPKTTMTAERFFVMLKRNRWDVAKAMDALSFDDFDEHQSRKARSNPRLSPCVRQYLETALFSSSDEDGRPLDDQFDISDFSPEAIEQASRDCESFLMHNDVGDLDEEMVGHNFWLTRNRHGAGFWDAGLGALGDRLTKAAHAYGSCDVYLGDDGKLHLS